MIVSAVVFVLVVVAIACWQLFGEPAKRRAADRAIDAALAACHTEEYTQKNSEAWDRVIEVAYAFDDASIEMKHRLFNQETILGCKNK